MKKDERDNQVEMLLAQRSFQPTDDVFVERIIMAARHIPQRQAVNMFVWLQRLWTEFHIVSPQYVFASLLVIGFLLGFYVHVNGALSESDRLYVQEFLYEKGSVL